MNISCKVVLFLIKGGGEAVIIRDDRPRGLVWFKKNQSRNMHGLKQKSIETKSMEIET